MNTNYRETWPCSSDTERPYLQAIVCPLTSPLVRLALSSNAVRREICGIAVNDPRTLTDEVLEAYVSSHASALLRFFDGQRTALGGQP